MAIIERALSRTGHGFAQELLDEALSGSRMNPADRRLAADLTYGVIRRLATLDAVIGAYSDQPVDKLESVVRGALRIGLYQMLFQERIPVHAAVNEAVVLVKEGGREEAGGFVNGVLRAIDREMKIVERADPARPRESFEIAPGRAALFGRSVLPPPSDTAGYLAASLSFSRELIGRWLARYGTTRTRELCAAANLPPATFVRPNALRISFSDLAGRLAEEGIEAVPSPTGRTLRLPPHARVADIAAFRDGLFQVQDDASALVAPFLGPKAGETVLDLCAAPGGKTCHLAELMGNQGQIVAVDLSARRILKLRENVARQGVGIVTAIEADAADYAVQRRGEFDRALLDAPCSNTAVLRRRVEARWRVSDRAIAEMARRQRALLKAALQALRPGGALVYSTCSLEPEENRGVVEAVLRASPGFRLDADCQILPQADAGDGITLFRILREGGG